MVEALQVGVGHAYARMGCDVWFYNHREDKLLDLPYLFKNEKVAEAVIDGEIGEGSVKA